MSALTLPRLHTSTGQCGRSRPWWPANQEAAGNPRSQRPAMPSALRTGLCGGGGMVVIPGAASGQTSRTWQGAWSTTNRVALPRLLGPSRDRSPSLARMSRSAPAAALTTSRSGCPRRSIWSHGRLRRRAAASSSSAAEEAASSATRGPGRARDPAAEQAQVGAVRGLRHLGWGDVQQRDSGIGRRQAQRRVHAGPPGSLGDPDNYRAARDIALSQCCSASPCAQRGP